MIVRMKKAAIIIQSKDAQGTISHLRSLGVVHVEHQQVPSGKDISVINEDIALIEQAINILLADEFPKRGTLEKEEDFVDWKSISFHIIDLWKRFNQLKDYSLSLKNQISYWQEWGDFDPETVRSLAQKGVHVKLYDLPIEAAKNFKQDLILKIISAARGTAHCVIISRSGIEVPFKEINLPKMSLGQARQRLSEDNRVIESIKAQICKYGFYIKTLTKIKNSLQRELEFHEVLSGMGQVKEMFYLTGYIPYDSSDMLQETAQKNKWAILITEPCDEDNVPTLIRNPRWVSVISPIFKLIEVVPGYRELDISLWFLIFLSVFFGILIGDAAYGLIFLILTFLAQRKWAGKIKGSPVFVLFYLFSLCAVIWGVLSGTYFGQGWLPPFVSPVVPLLRDDKYLQSLCFFLGAMHLSIAHFWRLILKLPSLMALAEAGWILILWGAFFLARTLILGSVFPLLGKWLFIIGAISVVLFTSVKRNIAKGIGSGLGAFSLNAVNSFTDVVSYIRLFAVGLATIAVADAFNKMAMDIGFGSVAAGLLAALILFLGHALNIMLGAMSVLVHGVRLNVLEFCNHIDIKWAGFAYRPLR